MNRMNWILLAVVVAPLTIGCADGDPTMMLTDASSPGCGGAFDEGPGPRVALGARLDVRAHVGGAEAEIVDVTVSNPAVFDVLHRGNPFALEAVGVGTSRVTAVAADGLAASVRLEVAEVATFEVVPTDLAAFNMTTELQVAHPRGIDPLLEHGYSILPDGELQLDVTYRDAAGEPLRGYGLVEWSVDPVGVGLEPVDPRQDHRRVVPAGAEGYATVTAGDVEVPIRLLPAGGAADMTVYFPEEGRVGGGLTLTVGEIRTVVGVVRDDAQRLVLGDDGEPLVRSVDDLDVAAIADPPWAEAEGALALTSELLAELLQARVAYVRGVTPGETTLHLEAAGVSVAIPVTVKAP